MARRNADMWRKISKWNQTSFYPRHGTSFIGFDILILSHSWMQSWELVQKISSISVKEWGFVYIHNSFLLASSNPVLSVLGVFHLVYSCVGHEVRLHVIQLEPSGAWTSAIWEKEFICKESICVEHGGIFKTYGAFELMTFALESWNNKQCKAVYSLYYSSWRLRGEKPRAEKKIWTKLLLHVFQVNLRTPS